jgi:hypothetical protein
VDAHKPGHLWSRMEHSINIGTDHPVVFQVVPDAVNV